MTSGTHLASRRPVSTRSMAGCTCGARDGTTAWPRSSRITLAVRARGTRLRLDDDRIRLRGRPGVRRVDLRRPDGRSARAADDGALPDRRGDHPPRAGFAERPGPGRPRALPVGGRGSGRTAAGTGSIPDQRPVTPPQETPTRVAVVIDCETTDRPG